MKSNNLILLSLLGMFILGAVIVMASQNTLLSSMNTDEINKLSCRDVAFLSMEESSYWKMLAIGYNQSVEFLKRQISTEYTPNHACHGNSYNVINTGNPGICETKAPCDIADANDDNLVNDNDLSLALTSDINGDGNSDDIDVAYVKTYWGRCE